MIESIMGTIALLGSKVFNSQARFSFSHLENTSIFITFYEGHVLQQIQIYHLLLCPLSFKLHAGFVTLYNICYPLRKPKVLSCKKG